MLEHERWLEIAKRDLNDAHILCKGESFPSASYCCQQTAEKALKAFLVFKKQEILKVHELLKLTNICQQFDRDFQKLDTDLKMLNPFATKFRYPSEFDLPDLNDTRLAIKQAESVLKFITKKISDPKIEQMEIE